MKVPVDDGARAALLEALRTPGLLPEAAEPAAASAAEAAVGADAPAASQADPGELLLSMDVWGPRTGSRHLVSDQPFGIEGVQADAVRTADRFADYVLAALA